MNAERCVWTLALAKSFLLVFSCLSKVLRSEERNERQKTNHRAQRKEMVIWMPGKEKKTTQGLEKKWDMQAGLHLPQMEGLNTNKRCGGIRWKVRAAALTKWYLTSHYIPFPPHWMIESCGKWKETARDGKSIWDAWRSLNQWLLWLHDSRQQESAVLGCTDKRFITRSLTHSKYNKGSPPKPIRALIWGGQVSQPPIGALETHLCRQYRSRSKLCTHFSVCLYIKMYIHWLRRVRPAICLD